MAEGGYYIVQAQLVSRRAEQAGRVPHCIVSHVCLPLPGKTIQVALRKDVFVYT